MTTEEKAKVYDEALERASKLRFQNPFDTVSQMMEHIFPELKESEDERIRKWLIDTIKSVPNDSIEWDVIDKSDVLAWLEKQGEQKPTLEEAAKAFLEALSETPYNNAPIVEAQIITKQLLIFLSAPKSYNQDAINEQKLANSAKTCKNDTLYDLLQKMPPFITVDGVDYYFVMKKTSFYTAYYKAIGEEGSGNAIFWATAFSPIDLLNEMLEKLKKKGLLE